MRVRGERGEDGTHLGGHCAGFGEQERWREGW